MNSDMKVQKAAIFPFDSEMLPFFKYRGLLQDMDIVKILSFQGWGMVGSKVLKCGDTNLTVELRIEDALTDIDINEFDVFWVVNSEHSVEDEYLYQIIDRMATCGKTICISRDLTDAQRSEIRKISDSSNAKLYFKPEMESTDIYNDDVEILYSVNTPVIAVCGMGERTNKIELQLDIKNRMQKEKYSVCWISTQKESVFFGGKQFPQFMFNSNLTEKKKILMYNHYLKRMEQEEKPDAFLLGIPGGIMPTSKKQVDYFGITAFEVFNAVTPDFVVMSLYCGETGSKYLQQLLNLMKYRYSVEVDCFNISDTQQDVFSLDKIEPVEYVTHDDSAINKKTSETIIDNVPLFSRSTYDKLYEHAICKLSEYEELKVL